MSAIIMKSDVYNFLRKYSSEPRAVDRLIVSSFLMVNEITTVKNLLINEYIIPKNDIDEYQSLLLFNKEIQSDQGDFDYEKLIELFEFVISPSEKVVNGAVYTPPNIREYIIEYCLNTVVSDMTTVTVADLSCGCGGFLMDVTKKLKTHTGKSYKSIYQEQIFGVDIAEYSIKRAEILLILFAILNDEDEIEFKFNLHTGNSLIFNWYDHSDLIAKRGGFDMIVGNPPYVCSRNMDAETSALLKNWEVAKSGHPDL